MLRLSEYVKAGGLLVVGDELVYRDSSNIVVVMNSEHAERLYMATSNKILVKSFKSRNNSGEQPVSDDSPVVVEYNNNNWVGHAEYFDWALSKSKENIKSWKPDIDKLIEKQSEHDNSN